MTYEECREKYLEETRKFHGFDRWDELGYTGQGVKILNLEEYSEHGKNTYDMAKEFCPGADIDWIDFSYGAKAGELYFFKAIVDDDLMLEYDENGDGKLDFDEFVKLIQRYDVITVSESGRYPEEIEKAFLDTGAILMSSAGNDGSSGVTGRFRKIGWSIGAITLRDGEIVKEYYSAIGPEVDFSTLHGDLEGTSFSSPVEAAICGRIIGRYYNPGRERMYEIMKSISIDAGDPGHDEYFGWGNPVLPESIESLEIDRDKLYSIDEVVDIISRYKKKELHVHHTWEPSIEDFTGSNHGALQEGMRNYHVKTRGFSDIAQHLTLFPDGKFMFGRDIKEVPASSFGFRPDGSYWNQDFVLMVETTGNFDKEYISDVVWNALVKLAAVIRIAGGQVLFHREMDARKTCPGKLFIKEMFMDAVKLEVTRMIVQRVFEDLSPDDWSVEDVKWCKEKGLFNGSMEDIDGDGVLDEVFHPDAPIKRKEVAAVMHRMYEKLFDEVMAEVKKLI